MRSEEAGRGHALQLTATKERFTTEKLDSDQVWPLAWPGLWASIAHASISPDTPVAIGITTSRKHMANCDALFSFSIPMPPCASHSLNFHA